MEYKNINQILVKSFNIQERPAYLVNFLYLKYSQVGHYPQLFKKSEFIKSLA